MKYLLDTHIFLWWLTKAQNLSKKIIDIIKNPENELYLSAISSWEICTKIQIKKLWLPEDPIYYIPKKINEHNIFELDINHKHSLQLSSLPLIHKDPFDRMLIAQAIVEKMVLLSFDKIFKKYPITTICK
ncbi:MAG: type II toxin-antitoxin system VapC family toxin [Gammaproteobacteria bacterium]|jgi:PIN domain nuclease of toxin-antitoxin system